MREAFEVVARLGRPTGLDLIRGRIVHMDGGRLVIQTFGVGEGPLELSQSYELTWDEVVGIRAWDRETRRTGTWLYRPGCVLERSRA